jgi:hypothetical protein
MIAKKLWTVRATASGRGLGIFKNITRKSQKIRYNQSIPPVPHNGNLPGKQPN